MERTTKTTGGAAAHVRRALAAALLPALVAGGAAVPAAAQSRDELLRRIEALEREVETLRQAVRGATAEPAAKQTQPESRAVRSGNDKVRLAISGHVNRAVLVGHDGDNTEVFHVDNDASSTRLRFKGTGRFDDDLSVGAVIEVQFESNSTRAVNQFAERGLGPNNFTQRKLEFHVDHKRLGRLSLGQGETATDKTAEVNLSGATLISRADIADLAGGLLFRQAGALPPGSVPLQTGNPTVAAAFVELDGFGLDDRIRYDTPKLLGFGLSASAIADGRWDVAARYGATWFDDVKVKAAIGYGDRTDTLTRIDGSVSVLHVPSGLSATFATGLDNFDARGRNDRDFMFAQVGWQWPIFPFGSTRFAANWFEGTDAGANGDWSRAFGGGVVQQVKAIATELYVGAQNFELKREGARFDDVFVVLAGGRVKF